MSFEEQIMSKDKYLSLLYGLSSVSGQDESNAAQLSCPLVPCKENFPERHIVNPLLTKLVWSRWLDIGRGLFIACLWTSTTSWSINTLKKNLANIQPS